MFWDVLILTRFIFNCHLRDVDLLKLCVCMYVRTYVYIYVCTYVCMYVCMYKVCPKSHEIYIFFKDLLTIPVKIVNILQSTLHEHLHIFSTDSPMPGTPSRTPRREPPSKLLSRPLG